MKFTHLIDHKDNITHDDAKRINPNIHTLLYAPIGLEKLYFEIKLSEYAYTTSKLWSACIMRADWANSDDFLKTCIFELFSCTLTSYVRLVGLIKFMKIEGFTDIDLLDKKTAEIAKSYSIKYTEEIIPKVFSYRNKVGAHHSFIDPRRDPIDDLRQSVMHSVHYLNGKYRANALRLGQSTLPEWSLTEEFERLSERYWPHIKHSTDINELLRIKAMDHFKDTQPHI